VAIASTFIPTSNVKMDDKEIIYDRQLSRMKSQSIFFKIIVWTILVLNIIGFTWIVLVQAGLIQTIFAFKTILFFAYLAGIVLMVENGTLIRSKLVYLMGISIACIVIGSLFKVQHWPYASELLFIGLPSGLFIYLVHFLRKANHFLFDYLKLTWVVLYVSFSLDVALQFYFLQEWVSVRDIAFLIMFAHYAYLFTIRKTNPRSSE
jgi:hypothetical protein